MGRKDQNGFAGRLRSLFDGRSIISSQNPPSSTVSPKSPAPRLGLSILLSPTIDLPGLPSHVSPSSRAPASPQPIGRVTSPTGSTITAPPFASSRQPRSTIHSPSPTFAPSGHSSRRTDWNWEHVRDNSGSVRRRPRRRMEQARPQHGIKGILREKAGRLKLIRCLGLGSLVVVGLAICKLGVSFKITLTDLFLQIWR